MDKEKTTTFYKEWLSLPQDQFRLLMHLARHGSYKGNLSGLCTCLSLNPQNRNRRRLQATIDDLNNSKMIDVSNSGRTWLLQLITKENEIKLPCSWVDMITKGSYSTTVSKEAVMKVLLWIQNNGCLVFTNNDIAEDLDISLTTINSAKRVLREDFHVIHTEYVSEMVEDGVYHRTGQIISLSAWMP